VDRTIGPWTFVHLKYGLAFDPLALGVQFRSAYRERHDFVLESARIYRCNSLLMTGECKCVGILPRDSVLAGKVLGGQPHIQVVVGPFVDKPGIRPDIVTSHWNEAHSLGTARYYAFSPARSDTFGRKGDRLQPGRAEAIDGDGRGIFWDSRKPRRLPGDVHAGLGFGGGAAHYAVFDHSGL